MSIIFECPVTFTFSEAQVETFLKSINRDFEDDNKITIEEVKAKPELLKYICEQVAKDIPFGCVDPVEFWNGDGWCDVSKYR